MASARSVIACVGAGRMGRGIAHCAAWAGHDIRLVDAKQRDAEGYARLEADTFDEIRSTLEMMAGLGGFDAVHVDAILKRVSVVPREKAAEALADARIVFEAVPETDEAKRDALALIDVAAGPDAIIASTTSTYLSTQLAALSGRPARFLNAHWLNPAFLVPLVELSPTHETDRAVVDELKTLLEAIGKVPVECAATPGYIVPRIQMLAMNEAARMVEEGVASAEDIDKATRYGFGFRFAVLGLLEFIDWGGGDILFHASRYMAEVTGEKRFEAPALIHENMEENRRGLRDGRGFYDYDGMDVAAYRRQRMEGFMAMLRMAGLDRPPAVAAPEKSN